MVGNVETGRAPSLQKQLFIHERREFLRLLFQHGNLLVGEVELAFGPGLHAEGDARLRSVITCIFMNSNSSFSLARHERVWLLPPAPLTVTFLPTAAEGLVKSLMSIGRESQSSRFLSRPG